MLLGPIAIVAGIVVALIGAGGIKISDDPQFVAKSGYLLKSGGYFMIVAGMMVMLYSFVGSL